MGTAIRLSVLLMVCSVGQSITALGQPAVHIDSLLRALRAHDGPTDTVLVDLHLALSDAYRKNNTVHSLRHADTALNLSQQLGYKRGEGDAANWLGANHLERADYPRALEYFFRALRIREAAGDAKQVARTQSNIGLLFGRRGTFDKAREYFDRAYRTFSALRDTAGMATTLVNIGGLYEEQDSLILATRSYEYAAALGRAIGRREIEAVAIGDVGLISNKLGNYDDAIRKYLHAVTLAEAIGDKFGVVRNRGNIGSCYLDAATDEKEVPASLHIPASKNERLRLAINYLRGAVDSAEAMGYLEAVRVFAEKLSLAYREAGDDAAALTTFKRFAAAQDSIQSVEGAARIEQLETERELQLRDKQIQLDRLAVAKKRNERIYFIAGLGLLAVVTFFIARERKKSEHLLLNILPHKIAVRLKAREHPIADSFAGVSIIFIDMVGFTEFAQRRDPNETVSILNDIFTRFDALAEQYGLEKIKTIGDSYMAVAGLPEPRTDHANGAAAMALAAQRVMCNYRTPEGERVRFRIGLDCGPVVAGVIGRKKFIYDLWGDAVNTASRMESTGVVDEIQCTDNFRRCTDGAFHFVPLGRHVVKGKGEMETWLLRGAATEPELVPAMA